MAERPLKEVAKTLAFNLNPDTMLVYSTTPGSSIDVEQVSTIKEVTDTPVFASNGVKGRDRRRDSLCGRRSNCGNQRKIRWKVL